MPRSKVLRSRLLQAQELLHLLAEVMMPRHSYQAHICPSCGRHLPLSPLLWVKT